MRNPVDGDLEKSCKRMILAIQDSENYDSRNDIRMEVYRLRAKIGEWLSKEFPNGIL